MVVSAYLEKKIVHLLSEWTAAFRFNDNSEERQKIF